MGQLHEATEKWKKAIVELKNSRKRSQEGAEAQKRLKDAFDEIVEAILTDESEWDELDLRAYRFHQKLDALES